MRPALKDRTAVMGDTVPRYGLVPIHMVSLPDNHVGMDWAQVEYYATLLKAGHQLVPVLMQQDEDRCWLIDGRHRFLAHIVVGLDVIPAFVSPSIELV